MGVQYCCKSEGRRAAIHDRKDADGKSLWNGIEYLEVSADQMTLAVHFIHNLPGQEEGVPSSAPPLSVENVAIEGGVRVKDVRVECAGASKEVLTLGLNTYGDFSPYRLRLVTSPTDPTPPTGFDPVLSQVEFSFKVNCPTEFDCRQPPVSAARQVDEPPIDYLAKDYASFRQLMLDRLAVTMPGWQERNPADLGVALVEVLAYAADHLSYYQDAVATEAYLGTARKRVSVRRHARLLDYPMHDGCNARTWVHVEVSVDKVSLQKGAQLLTHLTGYGARIQPGSAVYEQALGQGPQVFETLYQVDLLEAHNELQFYTWGEQACTLPKGATRATLKGSLRTLKPEGVLIFQEVRGPQSGLEEDADPNRRHAVRLTEVAPPSKDPLFDQPITEIAWHARDALPFDLWVSPVEIGGSEKPVTVALGNVVLADHGRTIAGEGLEPPTVPHRRRYRPALRRSHVTHSVPYDEERATSQAASTVLVQDPRAALSAVKLRGNGEEWLARRDLLGSDRFVRDFVVEMEDDGRAFLRFGDDVLGRKPTAGSDFRATYRVGNGSGGNVGAEAIAHVVCADEGVERVRNPLPARGGRDPETVEQVRLYAPQAFHVQKRAVTEADYAEVTQRHPDVQRAEAGLRWTGSWYTTFITVDRKGGRPVDAPFECELRRFLASFRLAGHDLEIDGPVFVPLDVALAVHVKTGYLRSQVKAALLEMFGTADLPDGHRGFFHPDNFTFGQPVYLSRVIAVAIQVPGVEWVEVERFRRWGQPDRGEIDAGRIELGRLEIACLDNDPNAPQNGRIEFPMAGGL